MTSAEHPSSSSSCSAVVVIVVALALQFFDTSCQEDHFMFDLQPQGRLWPPWGRAGGDEATLDTVVRHGLAVATILPNECPCSCHRRWWKHDISTDWSPKFVMSTKCLQVNVAWRHHACLSLMPKWCHVSTTSPFNQSDYCLVDHTAVRWGILWHVYKGLRLKTAKLSLDRLHYWDIHLYYWDSIPPVRRTDYFQR